MLKKLLFALSCQCALLIPVGAFAGSGELHALMDEHWVQATREQIFFRTDPDAFRPHGKLAEFSSEARARRQAYNTAVLARLETIEQSKLEGQDKISFKLFRYERETERDSYRYPDHLFPITSLFGYHTYFANAPANMDFDSIADYEHYLVSLADFPRYNAEHIGLLQEGIDTGFLQ